jgi:hypothetical protein
MYRSMEKSELVYSEPWEDAPAEDDEDEEDGGADEEVDDEELELLRLAFEELVRLDLEELP